MRRVIGYVASVVGWLLVTFVVVFGGAWVGDLRHPGNVIIWRAAVAGVLIAAIGVGALLLIRWARSLLGKPAGSPWGRFVYGGVLLAVVGIASGGPAKPVGAYRGVTMKNMRLGMGVGLILLGAALMLEAVFVRLRRTLHSRASSPSAATTVTELPGGPETTLPEPPPGP